MENGSLMRSTGGFSEAMLRKLHDACAVRNRHGLEHAPVLSPGGTHVARGQRDGAVEVVHAASGVRVRLFGGGGDQPANGGEAYAWHETALSDRPLPLNGDGDHVPAPSAARFLAAPLWLTPAPTPRADPRGGGAKAERARPAPESLSLIHI